MCVPLEVYRTREYGHQSFQVSFFSLDISRQKPYIQKNNQTKETVKTKADQKTPHPCRRNGIISVKEFKRKKKIKVSILRRLKFQNKMFWFLIWNAFYSNILKHFESWNRNKTSWFLSKQNVSSQVRDILLQKGNNSKFLMKLKILFSTLVLSLPIKLHILELSLLSFYHTWFTGATAPEKQ